VKYLRTLITTVFYLATLLSEVRKHDVVHLFSASYFSFVLAQTPAILVAKLYRKPVILNYRSGEADDHLTRWRTAAPTMRLCDVIAVPSGYLVDVFAKHGLQARAIHNIVDTERFKFRDRAPLRPVFFSNRNLEPMYNVACVLRGFQVIQRRYPEARLVIAGDGSQRDELRRLAQQLALQNVLFAGRVSHETIAELYDACDIYLNSSEIDNMPGSIIEAFAAGLPVITTCAGGIPWIVTDEETGLVFPIGDYKTMAAQAIRLIEDAALASAVSSTARARCEKYTWEAVRDGWTDLYFEISQPFDRLDRGRPRRRSRSDAAVYEGADDAVLR
jgi:glycosyltransferase involved in cell wall biosynthesis